MLRITDISYSIDGRVLIENATAVIPTGHKVGLVGRNGTGKTTLFKMIRGELILDTGEITLPRGWKILEEHEHAPGHILAVLASGPQGGRFHQGMRFQLRLLVTRCGCYSIGGTQKGRGYRLLLNSRVALIGESPIYYLN